ncbi:type VI secretion system contractile sheath small subunit [Larsenimonas suaedae]|uniref:Type VI secretion system contractile sheath small subunit n=1 Tax=Larsenimonas suaedae TaxID=1851019 RepID=A0ABU1GVM4_9GAMM|nr:type VI secretion system contractile sheath small subunit [Larsenimonas suaedae]MCM2973199.1 type VI secretion system contractile sheath small subunit [Larsenimonas suaedae]MDR5896092.1 type VI secretion system contractile sheath small subunit [Larsenimonas suaedae]
MAKNDGTVAPKERINIKYVPSAGDQEGETELPLKLMVVGDFKGGEEETPLEERKVLSVDKNNFSSVMKETGLTLTTAVPNRLEDSEGDEPKELPVELKIDSLADFEPDSIARQMPELKKLIELREALVALKGPLGNVPAFRSRLQELLGDDNAREQLLKELDLLDDSSSAQ